MNPYDEQEQKILLDASVLQAEVRLKKLYTWHDIDGITQNYEEKLSGFESDLDSARSELLTEKSKFHWFEFWFGLSAGLCLAATIFTFIYNK